jgi:hypothetical protein
VVLWVWVWIGSYSLFLCVLFEGRGAFHILMGISWGRQVSPWPPAVNLSSPPSQWPS